MKKSILILSVLALAAVSCGQKPDPVVPVDPAPQPETRTLTFVFPEVSVPEGEEAPAFVKQGWVAGDQIVVHGEYAKNQVTVTLEAADISADGKSATKSVSGLYPYKREDCTSTLYASYPASLVDNLNHCFFYSKFSTTNEQLYAACNSGDSFAFEPVCGVLSLTVDADYEEYLVSSPKKEALGYEFLQVKLTDQEQVFSQYVGSPLLEMTGPVTDKQILIYLPESISLTAGIVIKLKQDGEYTKIYKNTDPIDVVRGSVVDFGDVSAELQHYENPFSADILDLDTAGNANCYMVTEAGGYKFKAVRGNDPLDFLPEPFEAVVLWETRNGAEAIEKGSVITSATYAEDYVIIHTPETLVPGNAVIALKNADGEILWNWHIWIPATKVDVINDAAFYSAPVMDRNLGAINKATVASPTLDTYGMYFQWGRKDPFPGGAASVGATFEVVDGPLSTAYVTAHPTQYVKVAESDSAGNWNTEDLPYLWEAEDGSKTIYDPCPAGYKVPAYNTAYRMFKNDNDGWSYDFAGNWYTCGDIVLPICGWLTGSTTPSYIGQRAIILSSTAHSNPRARLKIVRDDRGGFYYGNYYKMEAASVRCVQE